MARDTFHEDVRKALEADGWVITDDPYYLTVGGIDMEIDLAAEQVLAAEKGQTKIAVEVKSFLSKSKLHDFYEAKGQYDTYRIGLGKIEVDRKLFLAVEESIYISFFQKPLIKEILEKEGVALIVFSKLSKKIILWTN